MKAKTLIAALGLGIGLAGPSQATTLQSNTYPSICKVVATVGNDADPGRNFVALNGTVVRGGITILLRRDQGARVCYMRNSDPANCASPMTAWTCAPISDEPTEILDIK